ncbi:MAG: glutamine amidotransferase [Thermoguttaceae bacterium]|jgi:uncharacterized membrane protein
MINFSLEQGSGVATMLAVAAVAIILAGVFYCRAFAALKHRQRLMLFALRAAAIVLVVLLIFRPIYSYQKELSRRPSLVFLLDRSASMSIADDATGMTRFDQARQQIEKWRDKLKNNFDLHLIAFAENAQLIKDFKDLDSIAPDGQATSLSRALEAASQLAPKLDIEAVILLSDGIHNSARSPLDVAGKLGAVVHCVGVGASLRNNVSYRDIQVTGVDCPDRLFLNNMARLTGTIEGIGLAGRVVQVELEEDGQKIAEKELTIQAGGNPQQISFDFRPANKGRHVYTVKVPPVPEEKIVQNNQRSAMALAVEPGIRVLYLEGTLRTEYGALVDRFLAKDPDVEFYSLVQTRPNVFLKRTNMTDLKINVIPNDAETINKFDVFIIGDIDSTYIKPQQQELFIRRVREGAGLIMLGGYHSLGPGGYADTPLGRILPVALGGRDIGQITEAFLPVLTPEGARHPIFANIAGFFPTRQGKPKLAGLPLLDGCTRVQGPRPGASLLAAVSGESDAMPILAVQPVEKGRTAVFTGDTTRKWQQGPRALDQDSPFLRFWGQTVRWLAGRSEAVEAGSGVDVSLDKGYYEPDEPVQISATVRDKDGQGANNAKVTVKIQNPAGQSDQVALSPLPGPAGHYGGTFDPKAAGNYQFSVQARLGESTISSGKIAFEVGRPDLEFEKLDLDDKMLARIAADAKGRYFHITTADLLLNQLDRSRRKRSEYVERPLYSAPLFWTLFVGVLTAEWILRRKYQLR